MTLCGPMMLCNQTGVMTLGSCPRALSGRIVSTKVGYTTRRLHHYTILLHIPSSIKYQSYPHTVTYTGGGYTQEVDHGRETTGHSAVY